MTITHPDTETSFVALQTCQGVLQNALPGGEQAALEPIAPDDAHNALNQQGWRALSARLEGLGATLICALSPESAAALLDHAEEAREGDSGGSLVSLFDQLGELIGQSLGVDISHGAVQEISCEEVDNNSTQEPALFAALSNADQILGLLAVRYDEDSKQDDSEISPLAHEFEALDTTTVGLGARSLALLNDVEMGVTAELGRTRLLVKDILALTPGSVIELNRAAGSPIDVLVNGTLIARGEVVVIDEEFGIRISEIVGYDPDPSKVRRH